MVERKTWKDFKDSGLLWFLNSILHMFGWAIVFVTRGNEVLDVYPARVKFRGFAEKNNSEGYIKVTEYLKENIDKLLKEAKE